jgi:hypothetical protein
MQSFLANKGIPSSSSSSNPNPQPSTSTSQPASSSNVNPPSGFSAPILDEARNHLLSGQKKNSNPSTSELISLEKESYRITLNGYFSPSNGFRLVEKGPLSQPLLTKSGKMVPGEYTALTIIERRARGTKVPHCVHVYSYPYEDLEIGDLAEPLRDVVDGLRGEGRLSGQEGVFGIVMMGQEISFCQVNR